VASRLTWSDHDRRPRLFICHTTKLDHLVLPTHEDRRERYPPAAIRPDLPVGSDVTVARYRRLRGALMQARLARSAATE